jgi:cell division protein FtsI/penicillin-binding protein 2
VSVFFGLFTLAVIARTVWLQVFLHTDLSERAVSQYQKSVYLSPTRGVIFDRRGREMAANVESFSVYAEPADMTDKPRAATAPPSASRRTWPAIGGSSG